MDNSQPIQRLDSCPNLKCQPLARNYETCYGVNGTLRACLINNQRRTISWIGEEAWSQPANFAKKEADDLKALKTQLLGDK